MNPWLQGLCAAAVSGAAGGGSVLLATNFSWANWKPAAAAAGTGAVLGVLLYLRQSPWPRDVWTPEQRARILSGDTK